VPAQPLVAAREILPLGEVAERSRQAVGAVLVRRPAELPQCILKSRRQVEEALAAEHDRHVPPARVGQRELVQQVLEAGAPDVHAEIGGVGEVRQLQPARLVLLDEEHLALRALQCAPLANASLQGPQHRVRVIVAVAPLQLRPGSSSPNTRQWSATSGTY